MYLIRRLKRFDKSYKKLKKSRIIDDNTEKTFEVIIDKIARGEKLQAKYLDHSLSGELKDYRECHIKNDLLLIYQIKNEELIMFLIDIGTHSKLFG